MSTRRQGISHVAHSPIEDAWRRNLPPCPKCHAWKGDPCRTPRDRVTKPHREREALR